MEEAQSRHGPPFARLEPRHAGLSPGPELNTMFTIA